MKLICTLAFLIFFSFYNYEAFSEKTVIIPFGAYNPELNTPADVWYDPPLLLVEINEMVTWINEDQEAHTVTSGTGSGRFGWMSGEFGKQDNYFDSGRFMPSESWSFTFDKKGSFTYFCTIHPWMEGVILVQQEIPNYATDALGNKIEKFPVIEYTPDETIEVDLTWEPNVIKTHEKVTFIYQFYQARTSVNLAKMNYDLVLIQNGEEVYRDSGKTEIGGDFREYAFDKDGPVIIRFERVQGDERESAEGRTLGGDIQSIEQRTVEFSTIVHDNPDKTTHQSIKVESAQRIGLYYELMVVIIVIPAIMFVGLILWIKRKPKTPSSAKSSPL
jgi:plastocyanin